MLSGKQGDSRDRHNWRGNVFSTHDGIFDTVLSKIEAESTAVKVDLALDTKIIEH